jgi:SAM-dependent methyltransferase
VLDKVKDYYGKTLQGSADLKTDACCTLEAPPAHMREILSLVHDDVLTRYYGCGLVAPQLMHGLSVLDLGCGAGRDAYVLSAMVGEQGRIVGVDMTEEQLAVARQHRDYHASAFGHAKSNVEFHLGYLEKLSDLGFADDSFDVIVSNCVINLCEDKEAVLAEALRVLKPGGELYFSDVYADRRVPAELVEDPVLYGECLSGALYWNDFLTIARGVGFADPRLVESRRLGINDAEVKALIGHIEFFSATYRLFKLPELEPACEDYGQAVIYKGSIPHQEKTFSLDAHHHIATGKVFPVCGNTWRMLHDTRFQGHFEFIGNWDRHYGIFEGCGDAMPFDGGSATTEAPCC